MNRVKWIVYVIRWCYKCATRQIETDQWLMTNFTWVFQPIRTILRKMTNHFQRTSLMTSLTDKHCSVDSEDVVHSCCRIVKQQQQQQQQQFFYIIVKWYFLYCCYAIKWWLIHRRASKRMCRSSSTQCFKGFEWGYWNASYWPSFERLVSYQLTVKLFPDPLTSKFRLACY